MLEILELDIPEDIKELETVLQDAVGKIVEISVRNEGGFSNVFINDLFSAGKLGFEPTGNAFRQGAGAEPRASASTLFFKEGKKDFDALVTGMKRGIIVDEVMGAHQASPFSRFSSNCF